MKIATIIARVLLGIIFFVFGLNKFLNFIPPLEYDEGTTAFLYFTGLFGAKYFLPLIAITEIAVGIALLTNRFTALALLILAPVTVNIFLFHISLDPANGAPGYLVFLLNVFLLFVHKEKYAPLLSAK